MRCERRVLHVQDVGEDDNGRAAGNFAGIGPPGGAPLATAAQAADASREYPDAAFIGIVQANWQRGF